ncbi:MAG: NADH-quinone oxidoreductase subunit L, partial [Terriglobia bacterium]
EEEGLARYFAYLNLFMAMMLVLVLADNFLVMFVGWEGVGLCSYLLIGFNYRDIFDGTRAMTCADAGRKAFMVNRMGDYGFMLGMLLILATFGSLSFRTVFGALHGMDSLAMAALPATAMALLLFMGATGKSAQIPLYVWLPDAMAGPTPVSALIHAATMVTAGVYMVCRCAGLFLAAPQAMSVVAALGAGTALLAALIGCVQNDIKKVLAYSTISQLGYMFLGVGVGAPWAAMFHLTAHAFFKACLFLGSGSVIHAMHHAQELKDMGGLRKKMPITFWTFVVSTMALAGIPFMSGFYSKDAILSTALHSGKYVLFGLGFFGAFLTAFYMTRLVWLCFLGEPRNREKYEHAHESPWTMVLPLVILAGLSFGILYTSGHFSEQFFRTPAYLESYPKTTAVEEAFLEPGATAPEQHHPLWFELLAWSLGAAGIAVGVALFRSGKRDQDARVLPAHVHSLAHSKYYMDEMYLDGFVAGANRLARACGDIDAGGVDGVVNAAGRSGLFLGDVSGDVDNVVVDGAVNLTADAAQGAGAVGAAAGRAVLGHAAGP